MSHSRRSRYASLSRSPSRSCSPYRYEGYLSRSRSRTRSQDSSDAENPGNNLYVTGLSSRVTRNDLEKHFASEGGKVTDVHLVVDPWTKETRGFGFVTMSTVEEAECCIKFLNRSILEGRVITVEKARRRRGRTPTPGRYLGVRAASGGHRSPSDSPYYRRRYSSPRYSSERDESYSPYYRRQSYSPYDRRRRSYSPYYRRQSYSPYDRRRQSYSPYYRRRSYSRSRSPHYRRARRSYSRSYSPYYRSHYRRSVSRSISPKARRSRRSYSCSVSPSRSRRRSRCSVSPSRSRRSYSRSYSPRLGRSRSYSPVHKPKRSPTRSISPKRYSRESYSHSRSMSPRSSTSRSVSPVSVSSPSS